MTNPTNGPANGPGNEPNRDHGAADLRGPANDAKRTAPPVVQGASDGNGAASSERSVRTGASDAIPSSQSRADAWNAGGSRSPGSLPDQEKGAGANRDPKTSPNAVRDPSRDQPQTLSPTSPKGSIGDLPRPSQSSAIHEAKGDDKRSNQSSAVRADSSRTPLPASAQAAGPDRVSPQDPKLADRREPIQPDRPSPIQPSRVSEPVVGAADTASLGDTES